MSIELETHEKFNAQLCSLFAGMAYAYKKIGLQDKPFIKAVAANYRRLYKLLPNDERLLIKENLAKFSNDPRSFFDEQTDIIRDVSDDDDLMNILKGGPEDE